MCEYPPRLFYLELSTVVDFDTNIKFVTLILKFQLLYFILI